MLVQNKESWRFSSAVNSRAVGIWGVALILFIHPLLVQGEPAPQAQEKTRTMAGISPNENWSVDLQGAKDASDKDHRIYDSIHRRRRISPR